METPAGFDWPRDAKGKDALICFNESLGIDMCRDCWNQIHVKAGCAVPGCQCGCYLGRNEGLRKAHRPWSDCKEQESFPDAGTISV